MPFDQLGLLNVPSFAAEKRAVAELACSAKAMC
jgi:hypothetical protein